MAATLETVTTDSATSAAAAASPPVLDLDALLAPIEGENPSGESLQYSGIYEEIREARRAEDNLEQGDWKREPKVADWNQVVTLAAPMLATRSKDLQICAWLSEALVKLHGFPGLRDGLKLIRGLHERYWDNLYPEIDEGDLEARANVLAWMDGRLSFAIKEVPLTDDPGGSNYIYLDWATSVKLDIPMDTANLDSDELERINALRAQALAEGKVTGEEWNKAKADTRRKFYESIYAALNESWDEFQLLDRVMDEKYERQTPGLGQLKKSLDEVRTLVDKIVKEKRILEPDTDEATGATDGSGEAAGVEDGGSGVFAGPIKTRQEALRRLMEVSIYFQKTEPHSPVSYLVQRAIKWGQMPLEAWLKEVVKDGGVLGQIRETLGLDSNSDGSVNTDGSDSTGGY